MGAGSGRAVVDVEGLRRSFGAVRALDGLDLRVRAGEVAAFLGPNGAGKSTTIRVLLGLVRRDGGRVAVLGADPADGDAALRSRIAAVPGDVALWPSMTGGEVVDLLLAARGVRAAPGRRAQLLERFALDPTRRCATYSKGNRQKVALVAALAADAELLVLDEPTSGLDPLLEAVFQECVREAVGRGASVLLSSHVLAEVEHLADTVTIVREGRTVQAGTLADLRHLTRSAATAVLPGGTAGALDRVPGVHDLAVDGTTARFSVDDAALPGVLRALADLGVASLSLAPPSLEELFLRQYAPSAPVRVR